MDGDDQAALAEQHRGASHGVVGHPQSRASSRSVGKRAPGLSSPDLIRDSIQSATRTYTGVGLSTLQCLISLRGQPDQRPPPVGGIVFALEQPLAFQMGDDLADHRLCPAHMHRGLTHSERARQREVLEHLPRRARQLAPGPVPPVKRQVDGAEEISEPFGPRPCISHATKVAASQSIVNPDESAALL